MSEIVKYRTVSITVFPYQHRSGKAYYRFKKGDGTTVSRSTLSKAKDAAKKYAQSQFRGGIDMNNLTPDQLAVCQRILSVNITLAEVDAILVAHKRKNPRKNSKEAVVEFLAVKKATQSKSPHNYKNLFYHLKHVPDMDLCDIKPGNFPVLTGEPESQHDRRKAWTQFFRWCVTVEYLASPAYNEKLAPQLIEIPEVKRKTPKTWTPNEMRVLLENVRAKYLPWLVLTSFNGLRTEEVIPHSTSEKPPLTWEDICWDEGVIRVSAETAKMNIARVIPISDAMISWLKPMSAGRTGIIGPGLYASVSNTGGKGISETKRLGKLVGGWRTNANRHSFISYRAALVGLSKTATEAGNSEAEAKKSYNDAKSEMEATEYFAVLKLIAKAA